MGKIAVNVNSCAMLNMKKQGYMKQSWNQFPESSAADFVAWFGRRWYNERE